MKKLVLINRGLNRKDESESIVDFFLYFLRVSQECDISAHLLSQGLRIFFFFPRGDRYILSGLIDGIQ